MAIFTTTQGTVEIQKDEISCYRGTGYPKFEDDGTIFYLKDGREISVIESFHEVDAVFDLL